MYTLIKVENKKDLKQFIKCQWNINKKDPNWIAPLKIQIKDFLSGKNNPLKENSLQELYVVLDGKKAVGRILCGVNQKLNEQKESNIGYFTLFESIDNKEVSNLLFEETKKYMIKMKVDKYIGPVSPTNGDDYRGNLVMGFNTKPMIFSSHNPEYYDKLYLNYGFKKDKDLLSFYVDGETIPIDRFEKSIQYAKEKYHFRTDRFDLKNLDREIRDIGVILDKTMKQWPHMAVPSVEEIRTIIAGFKPFIDVNLVYIARSDKDDSPIGFVAGIPDFNQLFEKMNGRMFPFGIFRMLFQKKSINKCKLLMQYVIPEYQRKGVNSAIYLDLMHAAVKRGYIGAEGGMVGEDNYASKNSVIDAGVVHYKTYIQNV